MLVNVTREFSHSAIFRRDSSRSARVYPPVLVLILLPLTLGLFPQASASLTGTKCTNVPPTSQTGGILWRVKAVNSAPVSANGVCFVISQNGRGINFTPGYLDVNPCGNIQPIGLGAGSGRVWTDYGNNACIDVGASISIVFSDALENVFTLDSVQWVGSDGATYQGTAGSLERVGAVGGIVFPVNKLGLLAPYIGLASIIAAATVLGVVYLRRGKRETFVDQ